MPERRAPPQTTNVESVTRALSQNHTSDVSEVTWSRLSRSPELE